MATENVYLEVFGRPGTAVRVVHRTRDAEVPDPVFDGVVDQYGMISLVLPRGYYVVLSPGCETETVAFEEGDERKLVHLWPAGITSSVAWQNLVDRDRSNLGLTIDPGQVDIHLGWDEPWWEPIVRHAVIGKAAAVLVRFILPLSAHHGIGSVRCGSSNEAVIQPVAIFTGKRPGSAWNWPNEGEGHWYLMLQPHTIGKATVAVKFSYAGNTFPTTEFHYEFEIVDRL